MTTFFCAEEISLKKSEVFLNIEVKTIQAKRKQLLWRLNLVWGKAMTKKEGSKSESDGDDTIPPQQLYFTSKILNGEESLAASRNDTIEGESCEIHWLKILGLRLERKKTVNCLCNTIVFFCFELLIIEAKFAIAFRTF